MDFEIEKKGCKMNHISHRNRIEDLMKLYIDFLPYCDSYSEKLNLITEIQNLKFQIDRIDSMPVSLAKSEIINYYVTFKSVINEKY